MAGTAHWTPDAAAFECELCGTEFTMRVRRHHCRDCGGVFCAACSSSTIAVRHRACGNKPVRVCNVCWKYVDLTEQIHRLQQQTAQRSERERRINSPKTGAEALEEQQWWERHRGTYESNFVRPSAAGIRRKMSTNASGDDLTGNVPNFSIVPGSFTRTRRGNPRSEFVPLLLPPPNAVVACEAAALLACPMPPPANVAALRDAVSGAFAESQQPPAGAPQLDCAVADFASYY